jgi:hypothetical protein
MALSRDLTTSFDYLVWNPSFQRGKPVRVLLNAPEATAAAQKNLLLYKAGPPETIVDVRGREGHYSIDSHGFRYLKHHSQYSVAELHNTQIVQEHYLAECQAVLEDSLNDVDRVHVFNWRVRRSQWWLYSA